LVNRNFTINGNRNIMRKFPIVNRTHYSILTAYSKPSEIAQKAKELGYDTVGLCDIGNVSGVVDFVESCKREGVRPIVGCEIDGNKIFAKNYNGWKQIILLCSEWNCFQTVNQEILASSDLIVTKDELTESRYIEKSDVEIYKIIRALSLKCKLPELQERVEGLHFPLPEEILDHPTYEEIDKISSFKITGPPKLPHFKCEGGEVAYLRAMVDKAFEDYKKKLKPEMIPVYENRITYEMKVIEMANLAGYFLIVQDFVAKARSDGQLCAVGRGCFTPETRVKMSNGLYMPISCISIGDEVFDAYGDVQTVYDVLTYDIEEDILELTFENGKIIRCTKDHKFLTERGWVEAQHLTEEDDIKTV
jgi:DNA polymerase III alpha subunit